MGVNYFLLGKSNQSFCRILFTFFFIFLPITQGFSSDEVFESSFNFSDLSKPIHQPSAGSRNCCAFGVDLRVKAFPLIVINQVVGMEDIKNHYFGGKAPLRDKEAQGEMYSCRGGFLDTAHIRHAADWTAYMAYLLDRYGKTGGQIELIKEGGRRWLTIHPIEFEITRAELLLVAQRMAYDTTVWHEILTWFAPAVVPFFSEKHSSFAPEDNFSNILGTSLAKKALLSGDPYNSAMTRELKNSLMDLGTVSREKARMAFLAVNGNWWNKRYHMPDSRSVPRRHTNSYGVVRPWRLHHAAELGCVEEEIVTAELVLPETFVGQDGQVHHITDFYELEVQPTKKIPLEAILPGQVERRINHRQYPQIVERMDGLIQSEMQGLGVENATLDPITTYGR